MKTFKGLYSENRLDDFCIALGVAAVFWTLWAVAGKYFLVISPILVWLYVKNCIRGVPKTHYASVSIFGQRWRRKKEGLVFLIPFCESLELVNAELRKQEVISEVTSKDDIIINIIGECQYWIRFEELFLYQNTRSSYRNGLISSIENEIGIMASKKEGVDFRKEREAIFLLINAVLRLEKAPHLKEKEKTDDLVKYYKEKAVEIRNLIDDRSTEALSEVEKCYGISIVVFNLNKVKFSKETTEAMEGNKQVEYRNLMSDKVLALTDGFKQRGASPQEAIDNAILVLGIDAKDKKVFSIQGGGGALPLLHLNQQQDSGKNKKDDSDKNKGGGKDGN